MPQMEARFSTTGLHCPSCSMLVDMTVSELEGVADSKTDHSTGETRVVFDSERVAPEGIIQAIRAAGYEAEQIG